jgi:hypothetical protein
MSVYIFEGPGHANCVCRLLNGLRRVVTRLALFSRQILGPSRWAVEKHIRE